jgi:hypothetical protein
MCDSRQQAPLYHTLYPTSQASSLTLHFTGLGLKAFLFVEKRNGQNHLDAPLRNYHGPTASCVPAGKVLMLTHYDKNYFKIALIVFFITSLKNLSWEEQVKVGTLG